MPSPNILRHQARTIVRLQSLDAQLGLALQPGPFINEPVVVLETQK